MSYVFSPALRAALRRRRILTPTAFSGGGASLYAVNGSDPATVADFSGILNSGTEYYRTGGSDTTFDSMFSYTGASRKTMTDSDGVLKWAPHNLLAYSEDFSNAVWTKRGFTVNSTTETDPDGGSTAIRITENDTNSNPAFFYNVDFNYTRDETAGFWVKANSNVSINLSTQGAVSPGNINVTTEWQYFSVEQPDASSSRGPHLGGFNTIIRGSGLVLYIAFARRFRSDLGGMVDNPDRGDSYVPTTTSAVYLPRRNSYRYNGTSYVNKGILLESEQRTNFCTQSSDLTTTWAIANTDSITVASNQGAGPDGATSLDELAITDTANEQHDINFTFTATAANWTGSFYIKDIDQQHVGLRFYTSANEWAVAVFDLTAGTVTQESDGSGTTAILGGEIEEISSGLYRISITAALTAASTIFAIQTHSGSTPSLTATDGTEAYAGAGTESFYAGFVNIELGSTPSSYIPTYGEPSGVTRAAETLTIAGADMAYSATAMSFHMQGEVNYADNTTSVDNDGDTGEVIPYRWRTDASNFISAALDTDTGGTGGWVWEQEDAGTNDSVSGTASELSPGVNVAFNIAARHTSSAMNGASAGTAATENSTPSTLDDLSAVAFDAGEKMIGTISLIRQWDVDLGDTGLESATS